MRASVSRHCYANFGINRGTVKSKDLLDGCLQRQIPLQPCRVPFSEYGAHNGGVPIHWISRGATIDVRTTRPQR